jgi:subtilisin family serine protease
MKSKIHLSGLLAFWALSVAPAVVHGAPLLLNWGTIETTGPEQRAGFQSLKAMSAPSPGQRLSKHGTAPWLVQFRDVVQEDWKATLQATGAELKGYVPENGFLIEATPKQIAAIGALPNVIWVGEYRPDYKKAQPVRRIQSQDPGENFEFNVILFRPADIERIQQEIALLPGVTIRQAAPLTDRGLIRVRMPAATVDEVTRWSEVEWIELYVPPRLLNDIAVGTNRMNVTPVQTELGLTGAGQIIAVCDTGLDNGNLVTVNPDFRGRIHWTQDLGRSNRWDDPQSHGTHVCGSVLGNGTLSTGLYRGVAYDARLIIQSVYDYSGRMGGLPLDLNDLFQAAFTNGARIHSDSWGGATEGLYATESRSVDMFVWNNRSMLVVFAAGNEGSDFDWSIESDGVINLDSLSSPGTAKNCLTVGAAENYRTSGGLSTNRWGDGSWSSYYPLDPIYSDLISQPDRPQGLAPFSSRGPCDDGRIKPDIVAPGTDIISVRSSKAQPTSIGWGVAPNTNYLYMGGTSMATPLTAGAAGLARQWLQTRAGITNPSAALIKALLMNGARDLSPGQYGTGATQEIPNGRPNNVQGWGHVDLYHTLQPSTNQALTLHDTKSLSTGKTNTFAFPIFTATTSKFVMTLAYSDYWGTYGSGKQLVNDLDLAVRTPSGGMIYPNGLAGPDATNNVETIEFVPNQTGVYTVQVEARSVPLGGSQPYALVVLAPNTFETNDLQVSPVGAFDMEGPQGGPFAPSNMVYTLSNRTTSAITWSTSKPTALSWLDCSPINGTLAPGASTTVTLLVNSTAAFLSAGLHSGLITFTNQTTGGALERTATVIIRSLSGFQWATIPSPQQEGIAFQTTMTAVDERGETMTTFAGPAGISASIAKTAEVGVAATTWNYPMSTDWSEARTQVIYLQSELGGAAILNGLSLYVTTLPGQKLDSWTIRMKHTDYNTYTTNTWEGPASGWTTVYQSDFTVPGLGWIYFLFSAPFAYDGSHNLMIDFCFDNDDSSYSTAGKVRYSTGLVTRAICWPSIGIYGDPKEWGGALKPPTETYNRYPNIQLTAASSLAVIPAETGAFNDGVWSGMVTVGEPAADVLLTASSGTNAGRSNPFDVEQASAVVYLANLLQSYDGAPKQVTATTDPAGLTVLFTYSGLSNAPVDVGSYAVTGTVQHATLKGYAADTLVIERGTQTIAFATISNQHLTNRVPLDAAASSGLEVTYLVSGPALRDGSNLTFTATGEVSVVASQKGNTNWLAAAQVTNTFVVFPYDDTNSNGLPDEWELRYFGNLTNVTESSDSDRDGKFDWEEFIAYTDPTNLLSYPRLNILPGSTSSAWKLVFDTATGRIYRIDAATNLSPPEWRPLFTNLLGTGNPMELNDTNPTPRQFYRDAVKMAP